MLISSWIEINNQAVESNRPFTRQENYGGTRPRVSFRFKISAQSFTAAISKNRVMKFVVVIVIVIVFAVFTSVDGTSAGIDFFAEQRRCFGG